MQQFIFEKNILIVGKPQEVINQLKILNNQFLKLEEAINEKLCKIK